MKHIVIHIKQDRCNYAKVLQYTKLSLVLAIVWPHGRKSKIGGRGLMKSVTKQVWLQKSELRLLVLLQMVTPGFLKYTTTVGGCCAGAQCSATFLCLNLSIVDHHIYPNSNGKDHLSWAIKYGCCHQMYWIIVMAAFDIT